MKDIKIYITGKHDYYFRVSTWAYYLNYKTAVIKRVGSSCEQGSPQRALLHGLYEAIQQVTEPCNIKIYSKQELGFKNPRKCREKDLILNIITAIFKAGHIVEYYVDKELNQVQIWEQLYGTPINDDGEKEIKTSEPDIKDKKTPNDVFKAEPVVKPYDYKSLYDDEDDRYGDRWVPGSGGY